jgi:hypothetical protein
MSNSPSNKSQNQIIELTPSQENPGAARPTDFKIEPRDGGQYGDSLAERARLLAEADSDGKRELGRPIPERNEVPSNHE